jgi:hypothetical protein
MIKIYSDETTHLKRTDFNADEIIKSSQINFTSIFEDIYQRMLENILLKISRST